MEQQTKLPNNSETEMEIDLLDLFGYYLSKLPLLIAAIVIGGLIAGLYTYFMIPNKYTATSRMYMVSASSDSVVNLSDLNLGASLSNDYVELMQSRPVIEDVIKKLDLDYTYGQLLGMIHLSVVNNTRIVKISVTSTDPKEAMEIANQMAQTSKRQLPNVMDAPSPSIAEEAVLPTSKSSPSLSKNTMMGGFILLIAILGVLTIIYLMDDTLKTSEDVEKEFGIMPLTVIPEGVIEGLKKADDKSIGKKTRRRNSHKKYASKKSKSVNTGKVELKDTTLTKRSEPKNDNTAATKPITSNNGVRSAAQRPEGQDKTEQAASKRPVGHNSEVRSTGQRLSGQNGATRPTGQRPSGQNGAARPTGQKPGGQNGAARPTGQRPSGQNGAARPTGQRPAAQNRTTQPTRQRPEASNDAIQSAPQKPLFEVPASAESTEKGAKA